MMERRLMKISINKFLAEEPEIINPITSAAVCVRSLWQMLSGDLMEKMIYY